MSRLSEIPVRVEGLPQSVDPSMTPAGLGGGIAAILSELAVLLERLAASDETAMIDLRSLPMSAADRILLQRALGDGEVHATLQAQGTSTARETGVAGVWWIEHRDAHDALLAELLEVARFPQILASAPDEIQQAAAALQARNSAAA
jgi:hydrogenase-1 operon protein HyaF